MTFNIFLPEDDVNRQRCEPFPTLYHCAGLTSSQDNAPQKSGFASHAAKHRIAIVFPDTSPRDVEGYKPVGEPNEQWKTGYGAGMYCDATAEPWSKNFNMYTYITKELPEVVEKYFHVAKGVRSIVGHSMGGNGALMIAARNPDAYRSVSAFAPICNQSTGKSNFCNNAMKAYFANDTEKAKTFDCSEVIKSAAKVPVGLVDFATHDEFGKDLMPHLLEEALGTSGHHKKFNVRWQEGYDHGFYFVQSFYEEHVAFHAHHLHK
jgi:S-formylglutathione hydrolase